MKKYMFLLMAMFAVSTAHAEDWYLGLGLGISDLEVCGLGVSDCIDFDDIGTRIFGGNSALSVTKIGRFGAELGTTDHGTWTNSIDLTGTYRYAVLPKTDLMARAGTAYWDQQREDGWSFTYALGVEQGFTGRFTSAFTRLEWQRVDKLNKGEGDSYLLSGGLRF